MPTDIPIARPAAWPSLAKAAAVIEAALRESRTVCLWGHDDIDGIASTAIVRSALAGRANTLTYIPPKNNPHYGLDTAVIDQLVSRGVGLLITVDSGISSSSEAAYAISKGLRLVITDHHELPPQLPPADAIVNPKMRENGAPSRDISGAAVALYLASLLSEAGDESWLAADPRRTAWAALATVSDRVPLTGENRAILQAGMPMLAQDQAIIAMVLAIGLDLSRGLSHQIISETLVSLLSGGTSDGFEHETLAMLEGDVNAARIKERWRIQQQWRARLQDQVGQKQERLNPERDLVSVIVDEQLPSEMIGPLAGRLRDASGHPVVVIGIKNGLHVGECRGYEPFDFTAMLRALAANFVQSGGHKQAAGFTVKPTRLGETLVAIEEYAESNKSLMISSIPQRVAAHHFANITELAAMSRQLAADAPYGPGNPEPVCELAGFAHDAAPGSVLWLDELIAAPGAAPPRTVTAAIDVTHTGKISLRLLS
jgi:single-stranded-DNA-specific exonuclease